MFSSGAPGRASCRPLALTFSSEPTRGRDTASASARTLSESNTESENSQPNTADSPALCIRYPVCGFVLTFHVTSSGPHSRRVLRPMPIVLRVNVRVPLNIVIRFESLRPRTAETARAETAWTRLGSKLQSVASSARRKCSPLRRWRGSHRWLRRQSNARRVTRCDARLGSRATLKVKPHFNAQPQGQAVVFPEILTLNSVSLFAHSFARALRASSAAS